MPNHSLIPGSGIPSNESWTELTEPVQNEPEMGLPPPPGTEPDVLAPPTEEPVENLFTTPPPADEAESEFYVPPVEEPQPGLFDTGLAPPEQSYDIPPPLPARRPPAEEIFMSPLPQREEEIVNMPISISPPSNGSELEDSDTLFDEPGSPVASPIIPITPPETTIQFPPPPPVGGEIIIPPSSDPFYPGGAEPVSDEDVPEEETEPWGIPYRDIPGGAIPPGAPGTETPEYESYQEEIPPPVKEGIPWHLIAIGLGAIYLLKK